MIKLTPVNNSGGYIQIGQTHESKEVKREQVLELLKENKISQQEASKRLDINTRQVRRLTKRYQTVGLAGLVSKKRGRDLAIFSALY